MEEKATIISLKHVAKSFEDGAVVVNDFNLDVKEGEFITILGPSGCGKTTTLRMIAGFETPSSGEILLNGEDISTLPCHKRPVNTVFQHYALFPHLDVYDNVAFGLKMKRIPVEVTDKKGNKKIKMQRLSNKVIDEKVLHALQIVDLDEMEDRDVGTLSGGQQQRVAIARAIVNEPKVLLLDEPLSALDHKMRKDMQVELKEMHKKLGITFFYVTHDQEEALTMSDRIVVMRRGEIQQVGTPEQIYNEPINAFVADFIGESNIYNGTIEAPKRVRFIGSVWKCPEEEGFELNEKVDIVIRPEDVILLPKGEGIANGVIESKIFKGVHYEYIVKVGKNEVLCRDTRNHEVGKEISIRVEPDNLQLMHKDFTINQYVDALIDNANNVIIGEDTFQCDVTQLLKGSSLDDQGYLVGPDGKKYDLKNAPVVAEVPLDKVALSDDLSIGQTQGKIISAVWIGDHWQYIIRTDDDEDFVVNSPYTWNVYDLVSIQIEKADILLRLKKGIEEYVID
ncbi:MAG: ABC transporter ATP-binding protein [Bacilli bacterium]|nr:ABC transporter ATP-binding protein [Bacilli bacterium]